MDKIKISNEMLEASRTESIKRHQYIKHHFEVAHLSSMERDQIGFLGEFAFCELMGSNWKKNIRDNYLSIDDFDVIIDNKKIDIKTETVPEIYAHKIISGTIQDDELYGRRLINSGQYSLLPKYDFIFFGLFIRGNLDYWYPIGGVKASIVLSDYPITSLRPDGGRYPFAGCPIPTSILRKRKTSK